MICANNEETLSALQKQFQARSVKKTYIALIVGELPDPVGLIDIPIERNPKKPASFRVGINGKSSQTNFKTISSKVIDEELYSLIELKPTTGRTHQLRVHLAHLKRPIVGDVLYEGKPHERLMLHASSLEITIPGGERKTFNSPLPKEFDKFIK